MVQYGWTNVKVINEYTDATTVFTGGREGSDRVREEGKTRSIHVSIPLSRGMDESAGGKLSLTGATLPPHPLKVNHSVLLTYFEPLSN